MRHGGNYLSVNATRMIGKKSEPKPGLYVQGSDRNQYRSYDEGVTWRKFTTNRTSNFSSIAMGSNKFAVASDAAGNGHIRYSEDTGRTWIQATTTPVYLSSVEQNHMKYYPDDNLFLLTGGNTSNASTVTFFYSIGGKTWTGMSPFNSTYVSGGTYGNGIIIADFHGGSSTLPLRSTDMGQSWTPISGSGMPNLDYSVMFSKPLNMWVAKRRGGSGTGTNIYYSTDNGANWTGIPSTAGLWTSTSGRVFWSNALSCFIFQENPTSTVKNRFFTSNDGINWTLRTLSTSITALYNSFAESEQNIFLYNSSTILTINPDFSSSVMTFSSSVQGVSINGMSYYGG